MHVSGWRSWLKRLSSSKASRRPIRRERSLRLAPEQLEAREVPATFIWDGGGTDNRWSTAENWAGNVAPLPDENADLVFPDGAAQTSNVNNYIGAVFNSITISGANYTLGFDLGRDTNKIVLGNPDPGTGFIISNQSATNTLITFNIELGGGAGNRQFFTVGTIGASLRIDGQVTGNTGVELSKDGPGLLTLSADNTGFTGPITVTQGVMRITAPTALGAGGDQDGITTVFQNATLQLENVGSPILERLILNGPGFDNEGALQATVGSNIWAGNIQLDSSSTFGAQAVNLTNLAILTISGQISDLGAGHSITKEGSGQVILARDNSYRGLTVINEGILTIQDPNALGEQGAPENSTIVNSSTTQAGTLDIDDPDPVRGGFTVENELVILNGFGNNSRPVGSSAPPAVSAQNGALHSTRGNNAWNGTVVIGTNNVLGSNVGIGVNLGSELTINGLITDGPSSFNISKIQPGRLIFTRSNTYTGTTTITLGSIAISDSQALGSAVRGTTVLAGASLELQIDNIVDSVTNNTTGLRIANEALTLNGDGANSPPAVATGALRSRSGTNEWSAQLTLASSSSIGVDPDNLTDIANPVLSQLTISSSITGGNTASLSKVLTGELVLTASNTYTGTTNIREGWITARNNGALGGMITGRTKTLQPPTVISVGAALHLKQRQLPDGTLLPLTMTENITVSGNGITHRSPWLSQMGALLNLDGVNLLTGDITIGTLSAMAGIGVEVAPPPAPQNSELTLNGSIYEVGGVGGITKLGSKRLIIQGDGNYGGDVDITAGIVRIQNNTALGSAVGGTIVRPGTALEIDGVLPPYHGGIATSGLDIGTERLTLGGAGNTSVTGALVNTLTVMGFDNYWRGPVSLTTDVNIFTATNTRIALGGIDDGINPNVQSGFTKTGPGKLSLIGSGTYRGETLVNEGVLTVQHGQALGLTMGGTTVAGDASVELQGDITVAGEPLAIKGAGTLTGLDIPTRWVQRGPAPIRDAQIPGNKEASGRLTGVAGDPFDPNVMYVSVAGGGAWVTKDNGKTWRSMIDFVTNTSVSFTGAIAVAPTDANFIYVGTGETNNSGDSYYGGGVYMSNDCGKTWTIIPQSATLFDRHTISKISVDPFFPNVIYVAVSANGVYGRSGNTGIWRYDPNNALAPWRNLTQLITPARAALTPPSPGPEDNANTNNAFLRTEDWSDVVVRRSPNPLDLNTRLIFAALGTASGFNAAGQATNAVFTGTYSRSNDVNSVPDIVIWRLNAFPTGTENVTCPAGTPNAGITFNGVARNGLIKLDVTAFFPNVPYTIYAAIGYATSDPCPRLGVREIQKSTNSGGTWGATAATPPNYMGPQQAYNNAIGVDPNDRTGNILFVGGVGTPFTPGPLRSVDGGASWQQIAPDAAGDGPHVDGHGMSFDANGRLLYATDGGLWRFANNTWTNLNGNLATIQVVGLDIHPTDPNIQLIGTQDNGTNKNDGSPRWDHLMDGDGGFVRIDPKNPNVYYTALPNLLLFRSDNAGATWTQRTTGINLNTPANFYGPYVIDKINTNRLVLGRDRIYETVNRGDNWQSVSTPDAPLDGGNPIDAVAISQFQGRFATDNSFPGTVDVGADTYDPDTIYATTSGGISSRFFVTKNHGRTWINRTAGLPTTTSAFIDVQVDPRNRDYVYLVVEGFDDASPAGAKRKVFRSTNAGRTWNNITANLPDVPTYRILIDPRYGSIDNPVLYIGNDRGVYRSTNGGLAWTRYGEGLPNTQVKDMQLNTTLNTISIGTYGRSVFDLWLENPSGTVAGSTGGIKAISGSSIWTGPITMTGDLVFGAESTATVTLLGAINDANSNFKLTKIGAGRVVLGGINTYGGVTEVKEGVLGIRNPQGLGKTTANTIVRDGSALELQSDVIGEPLVLEGNGVSFSDRNLGALRNVSNFNRYTGPITLNTPLVTVGVETGSELNITGSIGEGVSQASLIKEGTGRLILSAANTYNGQSVVNRGILNVQNALALGTAVTGTTVINGAQLQIQGGITVLNETLTLRGTGVTGSGSFLNVSGDNIWRGAIRLDSSPATIPAGPPVSIGATTGTLLIDGPITENVLNAELVKVGPAVVILNQANNYAGATRVTSGTLIIHNPLSLGSTAQGTFVSNGATLQVEASTAFPNGFTISGETLNLSGNGVGGVGALFSNSGNNTWASTVTLATTSQIGVNGTSNLTITNGTNGLVSSATADLRKVGLGTLIFPNANNGLSGQVFVDAGILNIRAAGALGGTSQGTTVGSGATLQVQGGIAVLNELLRLAGPGVGGLGALQNVSGDNTWQGNIILTSSALIGVDQTADQLILNRTISESGTGRGVTKVGPGILSYTGGSGFGNTYTGVTQVNSGTLLMQKTGSSLPFFGNLVIGDNTGAADTAVARWIFPDQIADTSSVQVNSDGLLDLNGQTDTWANLVIADGNASTGSGVTGVMTLGGLNMTGGTLRTGLLGSRVLLNGDVTATSSLVGAATVTGAGGLIDMSNAASRTFTVNDGPADIDLVIANIITGGARLTKSGAGKMRLTANNIYTGLTDITAGSLLVDGTVGAVTMSGGILGGNGTTGTVMATGGVVGPGNGPGILTTGNTVLSPTSGINLDINGLVAGGSNNNYDRLQVNGTIDLANSQISGQFGNSFVSNVGDTFTIITATGGVTGTFAQGSSVFFSGKKFQITYNPNDVTLTRIRGTTTTTLTSSANPSVFGQPVTFTATVTPESGTTVAPTGTVTFFVNGVPTTLPIGGGVAMLTPPALPVTTSTPHVITVVYNGDDDFNQSAPNGPVFQSVNKADTGRTLVASTNPSVFGQPVTFTVTIDPIAPGAGNPTGSVVFRIDGSDLAPPVNLSGGVASLTVSNLDVNLHLVNVSYSGDGNFNGFAATRYANLQQTVIRADSVSAQVGANQNPITFGELATFTASVVAKSPGAGIPTGSVTFLDGNTSLGRAQLDAFGNATLPVLTPLAGGTHVITILYEGDVNFRPSNSSSTPFNFVVNPTSTTTTLSSTKAPTVFGESVTFTASVVGLPPGAGLASLTGSVNFTIDGVPAVGSPVPLNGAGTASLTLNNLGAGLRNIVATYSGDNNFGTSVASFGQLVDKAGTTMALSSSANPAQPGQPITYTATVTAVAPGSGRPTGTISFIVDGSNRGAFPVSNQGTATANFTFTSGGTHTVTANYDGDSNFSTSSLTLQQGINKAPTTTTGVTSSLNPSIFGQSVTLSATVSGVAGTTGTPTGTVTFRSGSTDLGTVNLDPAGRARLTLMDLPAGALSVVAVYNSDDNFGSSTSSTPLSQIVSKASTTISDITPSTTTTTFGMGVDLAVSVNTVAPGAGTPTGTVTFRQGTSVVGTATVASDGTAMVTLTNLSVGTHVITAQFDGGSNHNASPVSLPVTLTITMAPSTTTLSSLANPSFFGQTSVVATVAPVAPAMGTPTGSVTFTINGSTIVGPIGLDNNGQAVLPASSLQPGANSVTATYSGDSNFQANTTLGTFTQNVVAANTSTTLQTSLTTSVTGQAITFTANVTVNAPGQGTATGSVTFSVDNQPATTVTLNGSGIATATLTNLAVGAHTITATYNGATSFTGSVSGGVNVSVNKANTGVSLTTNPAGTVAAGLPVTLTATVNVLAPGAGLPTGSVRFLDGTTVIGTSPVDGNGRATFTTSTLAGGTRSLTAQYLGDGEFNAATSPTTSLNVTKTGTATSVTSSKLTGVVGRGVTFTISVTPTGTNATGATPSGNVTLTEGTAILGTAAILNGMASITTTFNTAGNHNVVANYAGDANFNGSTSTILVQAVGTLNQAWISQVYLDLFGRNVDPSGRAYWIGLIDQGILVPHQVVEQLENSTEFRTKEVDDAYRKFLGRAADTNGINFWVPFLQGGGTIQQVRSALIGSDEYFARKGGNNDGFLNGLYQDVLGRPIDPNGRQLLLFLLQQFTPRSAIAFNVLQSTESLNGLVRTLYARYLRRDADVGGVNFFTQFLQNGSLQEEQIASQLIASPEYFGRL